MNHPESPEGASGAAPPSTASLEAAATAGPAAGTAQDQQAPPGIEPSLAAQLATVHAALAEARNENDLLAAAMLYVQRTQPSSAHLIHLHLDNDGRIERGELSAIWEGGQLSFSHPRLGGSALPWLWQLTRVWHDSPSELIAIANVEEDARCSPQAREQLALLGQRALLLLPLYSRAHRSWHGCVAVFWATAHTLSSEERSVYALLADAVASFAANLDIQRSLREVFEETSLLYEVSSRLNEASSTDEAVRAISIAAPSASYAFLGLLDWNAAGQPEQIQMVAGWAQPPMLAESLIGMRFPVSMLPMMHLWMDAPGPPLLISDVESDPRVDPHARALYQQGGTRCTVLLPLVVQGRVVGNVSISWTEPRALTARDERIFQAIAKHTSLVLQNRLLVQESQKALRDRAEQTLLLSRVLSHLPVGVALLDAQSLRPQLCNQSAEALLGWHHTPVGERTLVQRFLRPGTDDPLPDEESALRLALTSGELQHVDVDVRAGDERRSLETTAVPVAAEGKQVHSILLLLKDITERREAEGQRARIQDELIAMQAAALAERSTPIIPINDDVVVVPLIGSLDAERSNQLMDTVPQAASRYEAKVAIVDITGVSTLDTQAARTLIGVARALRLLGIEPVVTGMRAEVAQTLVQLGVRLDGLTTRSNLKSGIAYAQSVLSKRTLNRL